MRVRPDGGDGRCAVSVVAVSFFGSSVPEYFEVRPPPPPPVSPRSPTLMSASPPLPSPSAVHVGRPSPGPAAGRRRAALPRIPTDENTTPPRPAAAARGRPCKRRRLGSGPSVHLVAPPLRAASLRMRPARTSPADGGRAPSCCAAAPRRRCPFLTMHHQHQQQHPARTLGPCHRTALGTRAREGGGARGRQCFDKAFVTLFHITGGDPWPDAMGSFNEDGYPPPPLAAARSLRRAQRRRAASGLVCVSARGRGEARVAAGR